MLPFFGDSRTDGTYYRRTTFADPAQYGGLSDALAEVMPAGDPGDISPFRTIGGNADALSRVTGAAYRAMSYGENSNARALALEAGYDRIIDKAKEVTGVLLENPERDGYGAEAARLFRDEVREAMAQGRNAQSNGVPDVRRRLFMDKLQELAQSYPDRVGDLVMDPLAQARAVTQEADAAYKRALAEADGLAGVLGSIAGGVGAMARDPLQVASLFVGGGAGTGARVAVRIAQVAGREAVINAGVMALAQPAVQSWRGEAGLESGWGEAARNIALAAAFGAGAGGVIEGGREVFKALRAADRAAIGKVMDGTATPAEAEAALRAIGADADAVAEVRAAGRAEAADDMLTPPPPDVAPPAHRSAMAEAVARAESGDIMPAEPVFPVRAGVTDDAALAVLERDDLDALGALGVLRRDPELIESALSSPSPAVREAGQVALLGDEAFAAIESGAVDPRYGALVQRAAVEPERQAALMAELEAHPPRNVAEAREIIGDAIAAGSARRVAARIAGVPEFEPRAVPPPRENAAAVTDRPVGNDPLHLTPGEDGAGRGGLVAPGSFELAGSRERFLNDIVAACKV
ncbi:hypothetical protein [Bosea sp. (in: a-proteobacteria)]|uniref:hypothetical protein n=1 Tax=Bosea sp. (in: a-proteobacteria) TaxID=1871050 RepID=UPI0026394C57|nr:hypothetical protein [Bosea sp. (in: a-proteobacteria)]MCO5091998.1 hypothetical protein [Bosea sp. (in: a-proteobacteria)]